MNLSKKKKLTKSVFGVGEDSIVFLESRLGEIKNAITKQDIRDLEKSGAIIIKRIKGRTKIRAKASRSVGNVRKKIRERKREYLILTRKLRGHLKNLYSKGEIANEEVKEMRKKIRNRQFKSRAHLQEHIKGIKIGETEK